MPNALTGTLIRERRLALGLKQSDVAQAAGLSAPYLNLIEHNRRKVGGVALDRLAMVLGVAAETLAEGAGGALVEEVRAAAAAVAEATPELDRVEDFVGRFPGWAAVVVAQHRRSGQLEHAVAALNDRITHDPHLSASLHEVLSSVSSVRSTAAILAETEEIAPEWRARFLRNLHQDSERLAAGAESLVAYLDGSDALRDQTVAAPQEEMEAWLAARGWQVAEVETPDGATVLQEEVAQLASADARAMAGAFLARAQAEAAALPQARLAELSQDWAQDPALIARAAGVSVLTVMRRMALQPGSRAGLVVCDASGTMLFRKPVEGFALPRFGTACPLWPLFAALGRPMAAMEAVVEMAGRAARRFRALAICEVHLPRGFSGPDLREAGMLLLPLDPGAVVAAPVHRVGTSCRICPRGGCPARREPSILPEVG